MLLYTIVFIFHCPLNININLYVNEKKIILNHAYSLSWFLLLSEVKLCQNAGQNRKIMGLFSFCKISLVCYPVS